MGDDGSERVPVGTLADFPSNSCRSIADGRAVLVRVGDGVAVFENRCLHQNSPLGGGFVKDGVLTCPFHFWRYDGLTGVKLGEPARQLRTYPVEIVDGEVYVELPVVPAPLSMRDFLLGYARGEIDPETSP